MASLEQMAVENENEEQVALMQEKQKLKAAAATTGDGKLENGAIAQTIEASGSGPKITSMKDSEVQTVQPEVKNINIQANNQPKTDPTKLIFKEAIKEHETLSKKKWRNMTPYERSKVLETFLRMQREMREQNKSLDAKNPLRIKQDLSMCISVGTVKAGPNPHVKMAEKKLGFSQASNLKFDNQTLKDTKNIIKKVVKMQTQETMKDAHELES